MSDALKVKVGDAPHLVRFCPQAAATNHYMSMWSSPEAFSRHLKEQENYWSDAGTESTNGDFEGTKTYQEALDLGYNGWSEGVEKVYKLGSLINALNPVHKQPTQFGIAGTVPNVPRAVAGNIMNMKLPGDAHNKRKPVITLVTNMTASCAVNKDSITNRAAVMASIIDQIESSGFGCEVISTALTRGRSNFHATTMIVAKEAGQPVDVGRLAFGIGHVAMFRRLIFSDWTSQSICKDNLGFGLGFCIEPSIGELPLENVFVLPSAGKNNNLFKDEQTSATKGLEFILNELREQGCPAFTKQKVRADELAKKDAGIEDPDDDEDDYDYD